MVTFRSHEHAQDSADAQEDRRSEAIQHRGAHQGALAEASARHAETPLDEPWFPGLDDAVEANQAALTQAGQTNHALLRPDVLEGALGRAQNYWYYENSMPKAAAAIAHGVGQAQAFEDGNKRTAYWLTHGFLHANGLSPLAPEDDQELADHLIGYGEGTHNLNDTAAMFEQRGQQRQANILDPIHNGLDPRVFDDPDSPKPKLKHEHAVWIGMNIMRVLEDAGYRDSKKWLTIILTGSLTTYQYSDDSDCDVSLWVDSEQFPDWSRAEMIGLMIDNMDGTTLPGTPHPMQCFVVAPNIRPDDLYKPGLRSGLVVWGKNQGQWLVPPERDRVHDVEREENESYTIALENADKMERLLRYEPDKAVMFWHQIHKRRQRDMRAGKSDYAPSNITYKFLANRGLFPQISEASGEYIA